MPAHTKPKAEPKESPKGAEEKPHKMLSSAEFFKLEDQEAVKTSISEDRDLFLKTTADMRELVSTLSTAKKGDMIEEKARVSLGVIGLRRLNRFGHYKNKIVRDQVAEERGKVEEKYLQLQNLIHEVQHLQKEVTRCLEFKSGHEAIELVPKEEFIAKAPKEMKPEKIHEDSHEFRLARLSWELEERKILSKELQILHKEKESVMKDAEKTGSDLDTLKPKLNAVLEASRPLQELMDMKYEEAEQQRKRAKYLPHPLFYLYLQVRAYKEIMDKAITVTISGDEEKAKRLKIQQKTEQVTDGHNDSQEPESGGEEERKEESSSSGKVRRRKRRETLTETIDRQKSQLLQINPLSLQLKIPLPDSGENNLEAITVSFHYLPELDIITVKPSFQRKSGKVSSGSILSADTILQNLFGKDSGVDCPNPTGQKKLDHFRVFLSKECQKIGQAYRWAQTLAGLKFPSESNDGESSSEETAPVEDDLEGCNFLQMIVSLIRERIAARLRLHDQVSKLETLLTPPIPKETGLTTAKVLSRLSSWKSLTFDDFRAHPATQFLFNSEMMSADNSDGWYYSIAIERGSGEAKLMCQVHVESSYPKESPLFVLLLKWRGATRSANDWEPLRQLEMAVNCQCPEMLPAANAADVLTAQIVFLRSRLDLLLEVESTRSKTDEFGRDHLFLRQSKGPSREIPFDYDGSSNSFRHM